MLTARPDRLTAAVEALPEMKGSLPSSALRIVEQRERLLAIPTDKLVRYRINPRALEILPTLATERRDAALRERVIALATAQAEQMSWSTIARLTPWIHESDAFRKRVYGRARQDPPPRTLPVWLVQHWRVVLGRDEPVERLARQAVSAQPVLAHLLRDLELPLGSPLAERVLGVVLSEADDDWLDAQPYTETLRFIERSGAPVVPRVQLLRRLLARYGGRPRSPEDLTDAREELFAVAHSLLLGWPDERVGTWQELPVSTLRAARWCAHLQALRDGFGTTDPRVGFWRRWLRHIQEVTRVGRGVVGVQLGTHVFAEPREGARLCRVYTLPVWHAYCARQAAASQLLAPPRSEVKLPVSGDRATVDAYIRDQVGLQP